MTDRIPAVRTGRLKVPGATLHHEVRGQGPLLLLIPGGSADAGMMDALAAALADRWTVASYDPRGYSRSSLDGPMEDQRVATHSEDARRLIDLLSPDGAPAAVFGTSSSAVVALDLLARHPDRVRPAVAHEPPLVELLPDPERGRALFAAVRASHRRDGVGAALATMTRGLLGPGTVRPAPPASSPAPSPEPDEASRRMRANLPVFLDHVLCPFSGHLPDLEALKAAGDRLVVAVGEESGELLTALPPGGSPPRAAAGRPCSPAGTPAWWNSRPPSPPVCGRRSTRTARVEPAQAETGWRPGAPQGARTPSSCFQGLIYAVTQWMREGRVTVRARVCCLREGATWPSATDGPCGICEEATGRGCCSGCISTVR